MLPFLPGLLPFLSGFILAVIIIVPATILFYSRRSARSRTADAESSRQLTELSRLTGGLAQILDDFLRYIRESEPQTTLADINELISEMVDFYTPQAQANNVTIRLGLADSPLVCKIDYDMLKQLILNFFINAVQAMPQGGELIIRTRMLKINAIIEISDTGCGIEPDKMEKIFDAYYTSKPAGSGLGLSTARKIAQAHNGSISVNSQPQKGTSFTVSLPLRDDY